MRPDLACGRMHRHPLRVAVPDGKDFRRPACLAAVGEMRVVRMRRAVRRQADDAGGMGRRVLAVGALAAVAEGRPQRRFGDMKPAAEMMPAPRRPVAGEDGAPPHQPVALDHHAVDGGRRPAGKDGAVTEIDMAVDRGDIQKPALAAVVDLRRAGDFGCAAVRQADLPQAAATRRHQDAVGGKEFHAPGMRQRRADALDLQRLRRGRDRGMDKDGAGKDGPDKKGHGVKRGPDVRFLRHGPRACSAPRRRRGSAPW